MLATSPIEAPEPEPGELPVFSSGEGRSPFTGLRPPRRARRLGFRLLGLLLGLLGIAVLSAATALYVVTLRQVQKEGGTPRDALVCLVDPAAYAFGNRGRVNILCLGVDYNYTNQGIHYSKGARSDTMMVLSLDRKERSISVLSIPRDLLVTLPRDYGRDKINAAYALGGAPLAREAVSQLLGIPIHYCISVRVEAAKEMVDALGGLTLEVEKDMDYDDRWGQLHIHLKKGRQRLTGVEVVGYCRFRHDEEGDLGRIRRQQQVLTALVSQLKGQATNPSTARHLLRVFRKNVSTDLKLTRMVALGRCFVGMDRSRLRAARLAVADQWIDGISYLVPLEQENRDLVRRLMTSPEDVAFSEVRIEVLNGSRVQGAAGRMAETLEKQGFRVVAVGDADRSDYGHTVMFDRLGSHKVRQALVKCLPGVEVRAATGSDADLTIILGRPPR